MKYSLLVIILFSVFISKAQKMDNDKLTKIYSAFSDSINGEEGYWQLYKDGHALISISDKANDRMRIIMPIVEIENIKMINLQEALEANFHTALDVKYAISDDIMWSIFVHPLKALSEEQVEDALKQVFYAALTFGGSYSSTNLVFPSGDE